jgi:hypothetical protein
VRGSFVVRLAGNRVHHPGEPEGSAGVVCAPIRLVRMEAKESRPTHLPFYDAKPRPPRACLVGEDDSPTQVSHSPLVLRMLRRIASMLYSPNVPT